MARRVFITAAEVSGDSHAAQLIESLRKLDPSLICEGHGGLEMEAAGAIIHHETTRRAAMGAFAASRVGEMWRLLQWTKRYFDRSRPDLQICVDSPAMNFHFARAAHQRGIPVLYYIAPQLWAWRESRVVKLRRWVDQVACILPFEEEYFRSHGVDATFVGHPLFDELPPGRGPAPGPRFPQRPPVIGLLAGSRRSEANANLPHLLDVAGRIRREFPGAKFLVPTTHATQPIAEAMAAGLDDVECREREFDVMVPRCDLCLTVSGTATLHVAGHGVPMIVVYRGNPVLWHMIGRFLIKTRTFSLVNLLSEGRKHIVPEFVPWYGSNRPVADCALDLLRHPEKLEAQAEQLAALVKSLDRPGASMNAARMAIELMGKESATARQEA
jgi:lipid-A-disaccharide synthase